MHWRTLLIMSVLTLLYLVAGGLMFHFIESRGQKSQIVQVNNFISAFKERNPCINGEDLDSLLDVLVDAYTHDIVLVRNGTIAGPSWDIPNSIFFAGTVITTIGYGHLAPGTALGRQMCVFYLIWGIPLFMVTLIGFGQKMDIYSTKVLKYLAKGKGKDHPKTARFVKSVSIFLVGLVLFVFVPAAVFMVMEGWDYSIASYYSFISLSTVGFGDYVAGVNPAIEYPLWYRCFRTVWMFLGLCWLSIVIGSKQDNVQKLLDKTEKKFEERRLSKAAAVHDGIRQIPDNGESAMAAPINNQTEPVEKISLDETKGLLQKKAKTPLDYDSLEKNNITLEPIPQGGQS